ncbi:decapping endonuclease targeting mRNA [Kickxella alabastrina]|uniref:Decapping endonuclease targeting mRNA n=1 Tax=Kickxella alabastrina TaxID=61397 RepID=A0ACC1I0M1_9FUNG|nr:decapping endonuclease targeting mRNA [Kickxella alabastrina]
MNSNKRKHLPDPGPNCPTTTTISTPTPTPTPTPTMAPRFSVHPLSKYRLAFPTFAEPKELTSFSYDDQRTQHMDNRSLKYYHPPSLSPPPSLFQGKHRQIKRDSTVNEHIHGLLNALQTLPDKQHQQQQDISADFVMYRGMITRLFTTPYSLRDSWSMNAERAADGSGTIYIEDNLSPEDLKAKSEPVSEMHENLMYSGYKFETLCVLDKLPPPSTQQLEERLDAVVNTNSEYCSVFRTKLGSHSIISGAEIDCIDGIKPAEFPSRQYRELKTANILDTRRKTESFERFKLLKFWAQSFIAGIPVVTVGFRDQDGVLQALEDIRTREMPRRVRGKPNMWEPAVCMNFADQILHFIKMHVSEPSPTQYRVAYDARSQEVQITKLENQPSFISLSQKHQQL